MREVARCFIESALLGDFAARLDVLRTLALSLMRPVARGGLDAGVQAARRRKASSLIANLVLYYAQFAGAVAQQLAAQVGPIEREAKGLVTICRWRKSHGQACRRTYVQADRPSERESEREREREREIDHHTHTNTECGCRHEDMPDSAADVLEHKRVPSKAYMHVQTHACAYADGPDRKRAQVGEQGL